jgi:hypothetical protein
MVRMIRILIVNSIHRCMMVASEYHDDYDDEEDNGDDDIGGGTFTGQDGSFSSVWRAPSFLC